MPIFFLFLLGFYVIGNIYILTRTLQSLPSRHKGLRWVAGCVYAGLACLFPIQFGMRSEVLGPSWGHWMYQVGCGWLVFTFYMFCWLLVTDIFRLFFKLTGIGKNGKQTSFQHLGKQSYYFGLFLIIFVLGYGYYQYQHPITKVVNININKPWGDMHLATDTCIRLVAVSDIHLGYGTNKKQLRRYVTAINRQQPDLILIGGDLIDNNIAPLLSENMQQELNQLHAPMGIYMVPGNHEYISGIDASARFISQTPIRLLRDSVVVLPGGLQLVGRDDRYNRQRQSLAELMRAVDPARPILLLDHQPYRLSEAIEEEIDLQFSGHTHQGQIWPLSMYVDHLFELSHGYRKTGTTHQYVSSGLSLWGPPFRIGTHSELIVFNLCFTNNI